MFQLISFVYTCLFFALLAAGYKESPYFDHQSASYAIVSIGNFCSWCFNMPTLFLDKIFNISKSWEIGAAPYGIAGYIISAIIWSSSLYGYAWYKVSQEERETY